MAGEFRYFSQEAKEGKMFQNNWISHHRAKVSVFHQEAHLLYKSTLLHDHEVVLTECMRVSQKSPVSRLFLVAEAQSDMI
jgi:hypothetical protein